jgi:hypothetical protein
MSKLSTSAHAQPRAGAVRLYSIGFSICSRIEGGGVNSRHHPVCTRSLRVRQQQTEIKSEAVDWFAGMAYGCGWL